MYNYNYTRYAYLKTHGHVHGIVSARAPRKPQPLMSKSPVQGSAGKAEHADPAEKSEETKKVLQASGHNYLLHCTSYCIRASVRECFAGKTDESISRSQGGGDSAAAV